MTIQKPLSQPGCVWVEECIEICASSSVWVEEQGIRATFRNPRKKKVRKIHYDGCYEGSSSSRRADYIVGLFHRIDVIVELKGSDSNFSGESGAYEQVEATREMWAKDPRRFPRIAALIVYGRITVKKKLPGRIPSAFTRRQALEAKFLKSHHELLLIRENGEKQFTLNRFLQRRDA